MLSKQMTLQNRPSSKSIRSAVPCTWSASGTIRRERFCMLGEGSSSTHDFAFFA